MRKKKTTKKGVILIEIFEVECKGDSEVEMNENGKQYIKKKKIRGQSKVKEKSREGE